MIVPAFDLGQTSKSVNVTAQTHKNVYAELSPSPDKTPLAFYGTPGLRLFMSFGDTPVRGWRAVGDLLYAVHRGTFYEINNAGVPVARGTIGTVSGRVGIEYNGLQIGVVDGSHLYIYDLTTRAFSVVTSELFVTPFDITWLKHVFCYAFINSGVFQISAIDDGTQADGLDFATAESNPDNIARLIEDHGELILFGTSGAEFWTNNGNSDFPFSNQPGSEIEFGLAAPWSLVQFNDSLAGVMTNSKMGQVQIMMLRGHAPTPISTPALDAIINSYSTVADATAFSYLNGGHPMAQFNFPSAGKSWLYDALSGLWSELESGLNGMRHRAEMGVNYLNRTLVSDYENGNIYILDPEALTDNGTPILREITARHTFMNLEPFRYGWLQLDFETGIGLPNGQGSDPQVMLQLSRDGGHKWGNEMWRSIGMTGEYKKKPVWRRLGRGRDFVFRLRVTDPVKFVLMGAAITDEQ